MTREYTRRVLRADLRRPRHHAVKQLIVTAPHPAHAALAHELGLS